MIELNKRCYMDERTLLKTAGAARMATILRGLYRRLLRRPTATRTPFHTIKMCLRTDRSRIGAAALVTSLTANSGSAGTG